MSTKKALTWLGVWVGLALLFNAGIYVLSGPQKAAEFFGGYIIEQSLSLDNLFLFLLIFESFGLKSEYQRRVLNYGIIGAVILRLIFVALGVTIVNKFHWILYVFGIVLLISGFKMMFKEEKVKDLKECKLIRVLEKFIPFTENLHGEKFFTREKGVLYATPLMAILLIIEGSDIIFAVDSIPAVFSITTDPFIVYTSNIFAIMGLRNMYFLLEKLNKSFAYVKYGVAVILIFTGIKLSILFFHVEIPLLLSLTIIFSIMALSIVISMVLKSRTERSTEA